MTTILDPVPTLARSGARRDRTRIRVLICLGLLVAIGVPVALVIPIAVLVERQLGQNTFFALTAALATVAMAVTALGARRIDPRQG
ncbi:MAG: hypothetical protein QOK21_4176, partial [Solirubrobacteraceae bacterium]|nr:hypothetical protein [Solirubrobacteraceae bacterium]